MTTLTQTTQKPLSQRGNEQLALKVITEAVAQGVTEFCFCPGARNSPLFTVLQKNTSLKKYFWFEERSAAFFALGRSRASGSPVAVITTSGTAAGELLPAAMEAYYTGVPLLLITADRPRRFRGSGAPQAAEQVGLFGIYAPFTLDVAEGQDCQLNQWNKKSVAHLNVCFEEPFPSPISKGAAPLLSGSVDLDTFLAQVRNPFVVVSTLPPASRANVVKFLLKLGAPVYLEGISGIANEKALQHLRIRRSEGLWIASEQAGYTIDGVLRIGGVPTFKFWRDLEEKKNSIAVCSISEQPFSGLSWGGVSSELKMPHRSFEGGAKRWIAEDAIFYQKLLSLFYEVPTAEPSLIYHLSKHISSQAHIYLGNSLPIRHWDLASSNDCAQCITASRGLNGIDGQIATFLGLCNSHSENWAVLGDLTTLYDMAGLWVLQQLEIAVNLVVINNGGGKIFSKFLSDPSYLNAHDLHFDPLAQLWGMQYECWKTIPTGGSVKGPSRIIEIIPDNAATERFAQKLSLL